MDTSKFDPTGMKMRRMMMTTTTTKGKNVDNNNDVNDNNNNDSDTANGNDHDDKGSNLRKIKKRNIGEYDDDMSFGQGRDRAKKYNKLRDCTKNTRGITFC